MPILLLTSHLVCYFTRKKTKQYLEWAVLFCSSALFCSLFLALRTSSNFTSAQPSQLDSYDFYRALLPQLSCVVAQTPVCVVLRL